jgi:hypothetical protein
MLHQHIPYDRVSSLGGGIRGQDILALYAYFTATVNDLERDPYFHLGLPLPDDKYCRVLRNSR